MLRKRKIGAEETALTGLAIYVDEAAMLLHDAVNGGQGHATGAAVLAIHEEGFEDVLAGLGVHADSGIGHGKHGVRAWRNVGIETAEGIIKLRSFGFNAQEAAVGHAVPGVETQVHEHVLDLRGIGLDGLEGSGGQLHFDILAENFIQKSDHATGDGVQIDGARLQHLTASESQEFAGETGSAIRLFANSREALGDLGFALTQFEAQLRPAQDCTDHVIEIMRNAASELANSFEFLRLAQLTFHGAKLGNVLDDYFNGPRGIRR